MWFILYYLIMVLFFARIAMIYFAKVVGFVSYYRKKELKNAAAMAHMYALVPTFFMLYFTAVSHWHPIVAFLVALWFSVFAAKTARETVILDIECGRDAESRKQLIAFVISGFVAIVLTLAISYGVRFIP